MNKKTIDNIIDYYKRVSWLKIMLLFFISLSSTVASAKEFVFNKESPIIDPIHSL